MSMRTTESLDNLLRKTMVRSKLSTRTFLWHTEGCFYYLTPIFVFSKGIDTVSAVGTVQESPPSCGVSRMESWRAFQARMSLEHVSLSTIRVRMLTSAYWSSFQKTQTSPRKELPVYLKFCLRSALHPVQEAASLRKSDLCPVAGR